MNTIVWQPKAPQNTQLAQFMIDVARTHHVNLNDYQTLHRWSVEHPALFWSALCDFFHITFDTPATQVLNDYTHMLDARWFEGATFNFAQQLLSRRDEHTALVCIKETGERQTYTYNALYAQVAQCVEGLLKAGVTVGDRVVGVLPNTDYAVIAMLATTAIGAIWASCSPDFGADAMIDRFKQIEPRALFICDGYLYQDKRFELSDKLQALRAQLPTLEQIVICPFLDKAPSVPAYALSWPSFLQPASSIAFVSLPFNHPIYIMFSSGTTGAPKCIVHGAGGTLLQHIKELGLHTDLRAEDNLCFYTTCGWMMWNWSVSSLALGATLTLYDGAPLYPDPNRLFKLIDQERISVFGTSAKFLSAVDKATAIPNRTCDLTSLRTILSTGSPLLPKNYDFVYNHIKSDVQLASISGGTDIISCFALGNPMLPIYRGELQCVGLGMDVAIFNDEGKPCVEEVGELVCKTPFPSMPIYFWNDPLQTRYRHAYFDKFPAVWAHGDSAELTAHHSLIIYGRSDTILNPGGIRIGTAEIYHQVEKIDEVIDSVVIAQSWDDDVRVILFVKLRNGLTLDDALINKIKCMIRTQASPRHVPAKILQVSDIPRTINGKIVELAVRDTVEGRPINNLGSIANPEALNEFKNRPELQAC